MFTALLESWHHGRGFSSQVAVVCDSDEWLQVFMDSSFSSRQFSPSWEAAAEGFAGLPVALWRLRLVRGESEYLVVKLLAASGSSARIAISELPLLFIVPPDCTHIGCVLRYVHCGFLSTRFCAECE